MLYKFRGVDENSFQWVKDILETGKFRCSGLWEHNDPMEGVYSYDRTQIDAAELVDVFDAKSDYRICCFSGRRALSRITMWGHYANGFRGIAIEIKAKKDELREVDYQPSGAAWLRKVPGASEDENIIRVLTTKLKPWRTEYEYRLLARTAHFPDQNNTSCVIGKIKGVYFGGPYHNVNNWHQVYKSPKLRSYREFRRQLVEVAMQSGYQCYSTDIVNGKVTWTRFWPEIAKTNRRKRP